jgi:protein-S-isoprenylcysteine O-methyltransferase Ste14
MAKAAAYSPSAVMSNIATAGLKMTPPAIVALVGYAILVFIVLLPVDMYTYDDSSKGYTKQRYSLPQRLLLVLLLLLPFVLSIYSVNCMMVGNCVTWSWIVAVITVIWAAVIAVTTFSTGAFQLDQLV